MKRLFAWACALFLIPALALAATPTQVILATDPGGSTSYTTGMATGTCAAGKVAVAVVTMGGVTTGSIKDSTDNNTASWTLAGAADNHASVAVFKRVLSAGAFTTSTTFTVASAGASDGNIVVVYCFADGTGIPTTGDGFNDIGLGGGFGPIPVNAPSASTSYQIAGYSTTNTAGTLPDPGTSDASWSNLLTSASVVGSVNTYYLAIAIRQGGGGTNLGGAASFTFNEVAWGEVAASGGGGSPPPTRTMTGAGL